MNDISVAITPQPAQNSNYIIEELIRFIPSQCLLCLKDSPEANVPLTPACNQLLELFLNNQGVVLSREVILDYFWKNAGTTPSSNSINSYVSAIRRGFVSLGLSQEVITTVYKVGFVVNPDLLISIEKNEAVAVPSVMPKVNTETVYKSQSKQWIFYLLMLISGGLATLSMFLSEPNLIYPQYLATIGKCQVSFLPVYPDHHAYPNQETVGEIIKTSGFTCSEGDEIMFYADRNIHAGDIGNVFVAYCRKVSKGNESCQNATYLNWRSTK
ncbi:winged helix-turn-helix domain-containing protein [Pantoea allii]|uniref:winged helix-turn-helix domain-containing protein n=1 Tax=Pantoea TaxID=53335 RepID=UPI0007C72B2B|nr:winged helix-turn-helix domain-containing protein [Pantoea sp. OXWO6B1]OAE08592.1 hypothetical protein A6A26_13675 [Pantoea sp. OXWO6B1]